MKQSWQHCLCSPCILGFQSRPNNTLLDNQIGDKLLDKLAAWESGCLPKKSPWVIWLLSLQANTLLASVGIRSAGVIVCCCWHVLFYTFEYVLKACFYTKVLTEMNHLVRISHFFESLSILNVEPHRQQRLSPPVAAQIVRGARRNDHKSARCASFKGGVPTRRNAAFCSAENPGGCSIGARLHAGRSQKQKTREREKGIKCHLSGFLFRACSHQGSPLVR